MIVLVFKRLGSINANQSKIYNRWGEYSACKMNKKQPMPTSWCLGNNSVTSVNIKSSQVKL
jgi:hypothetical protein